jgi:hypothetical protein
VTDGSPPAMMLCMTRTQSPSGNSSSELTPLLLDLRGGPRSPSSCSRSRLGFPGMRGGRSSEPYACSNAVAARDVVSIFKLFIVSACLQCWLTSTDLFDDMCTTPSACSRILCLGDDAVYDFAICLLTGAHPVVDQRRDDEEGEAELGCRGPNEGASSWAVQWLKQQGAQPRPYKVDRMSKLDTALTTAASIHPVHVHNNSRWLAGAPTDATARQVEQRNRSAAQIRRKRLSTILRSLCTRPLCAGR